jgi:colanic acid biosynthesis protein WcaH
MEITPRKFISKKQYKRILNSMPVICVDGVIIHNGRYLLIKRENEPLKGKYWTPGGRVYRGEKITDALIRKMKEECGLDIKIISLMGFYEDFYTKNEQEIDYVHTVSFVYSAMTDTDKVMLDNQSSDYIWAKRLPRAFKIQT